MVLGVFFGVIGAQEGGVGGDLHAWNRLSALPCPGDAEGQREEHVHQEAVEVRAGEAGAAVSLIKCCYGHTCALVWGRGGCRIWGHTHTHAYRAAANWFLLENIQNRQKKKTVTQEAEQAPLSRTPREYVNTPLPPPAAAPRSTAAPGGACGQGASGVKALQRGRWQRPLSPAPWSPRSPAPPVLPVPR